MLRCVQPQGVWSYHCSVISIPPSLLFDRADRVCSKLPFAADAEEEVRKHVQRFRRIRRRRLTPPHDELADVLVRSLRRDVRCAGFPLVLPCALPDRPPHTGFGARHFPTLLDAPALKSGSALIQRTVAHNFHTNLPRKMPHRKP